MTITGTQIAVAASLGLLKRVGEGLAVWGVLADVGRIFSKILDKPSVYAILIVSLLLSTPGRHPSEHGPQYDPPYHGPTHRAHQHQFDCLPLHCSLLFSTARAVENTLASLLLPHGTESAGIPGSGHL